MTEQQVKLLKRLLQNSQDVDNSEALDDAVLSAAKANAPIKPPIKLSWFDRFQAIIPIGSAGLAALSVMLTATIFIAMSQMVVVDELPMPVAGESAPQNTDSELVVIANVQDIISVEIPEKPVRPYTQPSRTPISRDQLLAELELPDTQDLLDHMQSEQVREFAVIEEVLPDAMFEINRMLDRGALNDARLRYAQLLDSCASCNLPPTLEALVSIGTDPPDSG